MKSVRDAFRECRGVDRKPQWRNFGKGRRDWES